MEFNPANPIVRLCILGMSMEDTGKPDEALNYFRQAWDEATNDFEKYLAAYYLARQQATTKERLHWLYTALQLALTMEDHSVTSAYPALYLRIAECYAELNDQENAAKHRTLSNVHHNHPTDTGPFYHGTKANLQTGDLLLPGNRSNYQSDLIMNHIYFTALVNGAGLAAALANGEGIERVYIIEPQGNFENDPNVTDKKFPGNPTRSYRTNSPLKIVGEVVDWVRQTPQEIQMWRDRLAKNKGEIIN